MVEIPDDVMSREEAEALTQKEPFKGWKILVFGGGYQLKSPKTSLFLRKFGDRKGEFYTATLNVSNSDEKAETALQELIDFAHKL
jgi:hypothetical protein